jgi:hypothetical protein
MTNERDSNLSGRVDTLPECASGEVSVALTILPAGWTFYPLHHRCPECGFDLTRPAEISERVPMQSFLEFVRGLCKGSRFKDWKDFKG